MDMTDEHRDQPGAMQTKKARAALGALTQCT